MEFEPPPAISVTRVVLVRVHRELDEIGVSHIRRIFHDLIHGQGVEQLIVDLSVGIRAGSRVADVLAEIEADIETLGGTLELRVPADPPPELVELANDIPTFQPLEPNGSTSN